MLLGDVEKKDVAAKKKKKFKNAMPRVPPPVRLEPQPSWISGGRLSHLDQPYFHVCIEGPAKIHK